MGRPDDGEIYQKYARELTGFAAALVGPSDAQDVVANVVLRAMTSPRWSAIEDRRSYLYRTVLHQALNHRRAAQRRFRRECLALESRTVDGSPFDYDLLRVLKRLSFRQRAAIYLTYWMDLPPAATAKALGTSERTVQREISRARSLIKEMLT